MECLGLGLYLRIPNHWIDPSARPFLALDTRNGSSRTTGTYYGWRGLVRAIHDRFAVQMLTNPAVESLVSKVRIVSGTKYSPA